MCDTCGCSDPAGVRVGVPGQRAAHGQLPGHPHSHSHSHSHPHPPDPSRSVSTRTVTLEQNVLAKNDSLAQANRRWLAERGIATINMMSSPGAGKTSLLERTIREYAGRGTMCVVEGDQETLFDAERIQATGAPVVQINTGAGCHLDADMLRRGLAALEPPAGSLLFVENVGNLVCPALFDLGEAAKAVIISVPEGDDKPLKYPHMFATADLVVINKTDLLPYVDFDVERCAKHARAVNPSVEVLPLSVRTGDGMTAWWAWLKAR